MHNKRRVTGKTAPPIIIAVPKNPNKKSHSAGLSERDKCFFL